MALWPNHAQLLDTMESEISPIAANPLSNTVFHARADIRIESTSIDPPIESQDWGSQQLLDHGRPNGEEEHAIQERAAEMQSWWDDAIARNMNLPDGYQEAAVLIIKWDDELDELKTRDEAEELDRVFREVFNYDTETVELNVSKKPQHQISRFISTFIEKHDGPNNLMIVYYTGHGRYREHEKYLELCASINPAHLRGFNNEARANWNKVEDILASEDVEGDILTILDTCYSSNHVKSSREDTRIFELLSACGFDQTTASPGEYSFTRALIDALKALVKEYPGRSFTTFHLNQRIVFDERRRDTPSLLICRRKRDERHISLAPLKSRKERACQPALPHPPQGYLTLRFALRDEYLNREQIEFLARNLSKAFGNKSFVGLRRMDYLGMKPARATPFGRAALALYAITQWKKVVHKRRADKRAAARADRGIDEIKLPTFDGSEELKSTFTSPTRKRRRDTEADEGLPELKKGLLELPHYRSDPPSPPRSDSSRVEEGG
ncbi:hypothetical protein BU24DRAFT_286054 [Aaosphaeria arxii CBS 175.79]|uniref:Uncharacterized protein n=1 Tax=Aaosphaeria arxii CBS 175.79 TaxID=1450172 RepID=A0A6A5XH08_9PLEO|nr:uncharacterized protein BU24DRAFT_286054 [Aaosphaeria arxii CBS 175.79]KAF2011644.1 hypothetical protein BU24DRAFT_286054 [Aaosphaeria arxii CBS 175.79]